MSRRFSFPALILIVLLLLSAASSFAAVQTAEEDVCEPSAPSSSSSAECSEASPGGSIGNSPGQPASPSAHTLGSSDKGKRSIPQTRPRQNAAIAGDAVKIHFFYGRDCPHCAEEEIFLDAMKRKYPGLEIDGYEVWYNKSNAALLNRMAKAYSLKPTGVPVTFVGDEAFVGFNAQSGGKIEEAIRICLKRACTDPLDRITVKSTTGRAETEKPPGITEQQQRVPGMKENPSPLTAQEARDPDKDDFTVNLPGIGTLDTKAMSLPVMTIIIAGLDSFNPCAFFVLFSLLGLLVYAQSRKKMFMIGGIFIFFSGFIYFLFMSAWLNLFLLMGQVALITKIAGAASVVIASINIKDYFAFGRGISLTIPDSAKPKLFDRMRRLLKSTSFFSALLGTAVLAIAANSYELLCTAGFPMVFTRILTLNDLPTLRYYAYLVLYNVVYIIPLSAIVLVFTITLGRKKLTDVQGRVLKLVSGTMMLGLGIVLLVRPALMNNLLISVALLTGALAVSGAVIFATKTFANQR